MRPNVIAVVLLIVVFVTLSVVMAFRRRHTPVWKRIGTWAGCLLLLTGMLGFLGSALSALGGLNWMPRSFGWPVGYATGVVSSSSGLHVVPHTPSGRIQIYDDNWQFVRGWHVDAGGGSFKLALAPRGDQIEVITARRRMRYLFTFDGEIVSQQTYAPVTYDAFPEHGKSLTVPTPLWLWVFSHPLISWAVAMAGMLLVGWLSRKPKPARRTST